jgi:hypothetical protein
MLATGKHMMSLKELNLSYLPVTDAVFEKIAKNFTE